MLTVWPELFVFEFVAVALLRIVVGFLFIRLGIREIQMHLHQADEKKYVRVLGYLLGGTQFSVGGLILVGLFTQPSVLVAMLSLFIHPKNTQHETLCDSHLQLLLFAASLSLLFLGAGAFAFDLPF